MLEVARGNRDEVGHTQRQYTPTGTVEAGYIITREIGVPATPGEGRRIGPCWVLIQIVSSLVRKLGCVKSQVLVKHGNVEDK